MKKALAIICFSFLVLSVYAQNNSQKNTQNSVNAFRNASIYFEDKDYGKALRYAEDAITLKKEQINY